MSNEDIIKQNQEIDRMVFGKTDLNDDGTYNVTNSDLMEKLEEMQNEIDDFKEEIKNSLEEIKDKINDPLAGLDAIKDKLDELEV